MCVSRRGKELAPNLLRRGPCERIAHRTMEFGPKSCKKCSRFPLANTSPAIRRRAVRFSSRPKTIRSG